MTAEVLQLADTGVVPVAALLHKYGLKFEPVPDRAAIAGSFWGEPEAGIVSRCVHARPDTPIHSILHEASHLICMSADRRDSLTGNAGGDDLEESAVCYLQIVLADYLPGVGRERLMHDMDRWGYSFRLGSTMAWFNEDADDAHAWLKSHDLLGVDEEPCWKLRQ
jgi:hypothetical protein